MVCEKGDGRYDYSKATGKFERELEDPTDQVGRFNFLVIHPSKCDCFTSAGSSSCAIRKSPHRLILSLLLASSGIYYG